MHSLGANLASRQGPTQPPSYASSWSNSETDGRADTLADSSSDVSAASASNPQTGFSDGSAVAMLIQSGALSSSDIAVLGTLLSTGSEIVFGIPIPDSGGRNMIRRVIVLAAVGATFYIVHFIFNLMSGVYDTRSPDQASSNSLWTGMSSLVIELSIPACGYYGAVHANRQLTCCFCSCNLFVTVLSVVSFIRLIRLVQFGEGCEEEKNAQQRKACQVWEEDNLEKYVMVGSMLLGTFLGCIAVWFGGSLYKYLAQEFISPGPPPFPLVGEVVPLDSVLGLLASAAGGGSSSAMMLASPEPFVEAYEPFTPPLTPPEVHSPRTALGSAVAPGSRHEAYADASALSSPMLLGNALASPPAEAVTPVGSSSPRGNEAEDTQLGSAATMEPVGQTSRVGEATISEM